MTKPAKVLRHAILLLMATGGVAFVLLVVAGLADSRLAAAAFGVTMLVAGADGVFGAMIAEWERVGWNSSPGLPTVPAGRLSSLGFGLVIGSVGMLLIGLDRMPPPAQLLAGAVAVIGFVLTLVGQSYDQRRSEAARTGTEDSKSQS